MGERRLAGTRRSDQGHEFAEAQIEVDPPERAVAVRIRELHVLHADAGAYGGERPPALAGFLGFVVGEEEHPACRRDGLLQLDPDSPEVRCGTGDAVVDPDQHGEIAHGHGAVDDPVGNQDGHVDCGNAADSPGDRCGGDDDGEGVALAQERLVAAASEALLLLLPRAQALYRGDAAHGFLHGVGRCGTGRALVLVGAAQRPGKRKRRDEGDRDRRPRHPDEFRGHVAVGVLQDVEVDGRAHRHEERPGSHPEREIRRHRRVVEHPVDAVPGTLVVEYRHRQMRQAVEEPRPQAVGERLGEPNADHEFDQSPQTARPAAPLADLVFRLGGGIAPLQESGTGASRTATEQEQQDEVDDQQGQRDSHRVPALHNPEYGLHERRKSDLRGPERTLEHRVVDEDLSHPRQQQTRQDGHEGQQHLGGEEPRCLADEPDAAPDDPERLDRRNVGPGVDSIIEPVPAGNLLEQGESLASRCLRRRRHVPGWHRGLGHPAPLPTVSASTNAR